MAAGAPRVPREGCDVPKFREITTATPANNAVSWSGPSAGWTHVGESWPRGEGTGDHDGCAAAVSSADRGGSNPAGVRSEEAAGVGEGHRREHPRAQEDAAWSDRFGTGGSGQGDRANSEGDQAGTQPD